MSSEDLRIVLQFLLEDGHLDGIPRRLEDPDGPVVPSLEVARVLLTHGLKRIQPIASAIVINTNYVRCLTANIPLTNQAIRVRIPDVNCISEYFMMKWYWSIDVFLF